MVRTSSLARAALALPAAILFLTGVTCRSLDPILQVHDAPLLMVEGDEAIWRAGGRLGWQIERESPGVLKGTLRLRSHLAVVRIEHDTRAFSIITVETQGIERDGDRIHPNYNGWIQNLRTRISLEPIRPSEHARQPAS
jgi:hypothetical protein